MLEFRPRVLEYKLFDLIQYDMYLRNCPETLVSQVIDALKNECMKMQVSKHQLNDIPGLDNVLRKTNKEFSDKLAVLSSKNCKNNYI